MAHIPETILYLIMFLVLYFQVFLILTYLESRKVKEKGDKKGVFPSVTILVPCFNEERTVAGTLESLMSLNYPKDKLEIIAIDDGSRDGTWEILTKYHNEHGIKILKKENGGKHTALNLGLEYTNTELVGCLDADSFVHPDALLKIVEKFADEVMAVTPAIIIHKPQNILQLIQKAEYNMGVFTRKMLSTFNGMYVTPGPFSIFRKSVFDQIGGYRHGHNTEDMELAMRMQKHNMRIENSHEAYVYTVAPKTVRALHKQRVRWIYGFIKNAMDHKSLFFKKEYGDFGIYLPFALISIPIGLYSFFFLAYQTAAAGYEKYVELQMIGMEWNGFNFDWFFVNTTVTSFMSLFLMAITITLLLVGRKMAGEKFRLSKDIFLFIIFYSFLFPFWFMRALYNAATSKATSWR